jgi:hypothetical protein
MKKPIILIILASNLLFAQSPKGFYSARQTTGLMNNKTTGLSTADQNWRCIARTHYKSAIYSIDSIDWTFSIRDTLIYDKKGNLVQTKISKAQNGWSKDSIFHTDSCTYDEHNAIQSRLITTDSATGQTSRSKTIFSYLLSGKVCVRTTYESYNENYTWILAYKDSTVYSVPISDFMGPKDYAHFICSYSYTFDRLKSTCNMSGFTSKVDSECTANTLVERGGYWSAGNWYDVKQTHLFRSSDWKNSNLEEETYQRTNSLSGKYFLQKIKHFQDVYGNDTLHYSFLYDANRSVWDSGSAYRNVRTYDNSGNEIMNIESYSYSGLNHFRVAEKITSIYAQIPSSLVKQQSSFFPKITLARTANSIRVIGQGILAINLYTLSGQLIASVTKMSESGTSLQCLSLTNLQTTPGTFVAEVTSKNGSRSYLISIQK